MDQVIAIQNNKKQWGWLLFLGISLGLSIQHLQFYVPANFEILAGLVLSPFIIRVQQPRVFSLRCGWLSLLMLGLYSVIHLESTFYFGCCFLVLFVLENTLGKLNKAAFFLVLVSSPVAAYVFKVFGFPIRLMISEWSVQILSLLGFAAEASGNNISMGGEDFFVESACAGLKMSSLALVLSLAILSHFEQLYKKAMGYLGIISILSIGLFLVIVSNLFRVIFLILFKIPEDTFSHEMMGLACLGFYCIIPLIFLIKLIIKRKTSTVDLAATNKSNHSIWLLLIVTFQLIFLTTYFIQSDYGVKASANQNIEQVFVPGFESSLEDFGGTKLSNEESLIYYKPVQRYWGADHNPLVCWKGSGYVLKKEKEKVINNTPVFVAELHKDNDVLHTAWWFDNGELQSISQMEWRMEAMRSGTEFSIVNVTCESPTLLENYVAKFLEL